MSSAWADAWGAAWGNSWGTRTSPVTPLTGGGSFGRSRRRRRQTEDAVEHATEDRDARLALRRRVELVLSAKTWMNDRVARAEALARIDAALALRTAVEIEARWAALISELVDDAMLARAVLLADDRDALFILSIV